MLLGDEERVRRDFIWFKGHANPGHVFLRGQAGLTRFLARDSDSEPWRVLNVRTRAFLG